MPIRGIVMPADLRPASADCTRRHWEALPASSRTTSGVQGLVEWNEHGRMRMSLGVRGKKQPAKEREVQKNGVVGWKGDV